MKWLLPCLLLAFVWADGALAHDSRPLFLGFQEQETNLYFITARIPETVPGRLHPAIVLPPSCTPLHGETQRQGFAIPRINGYYQCAGGIGGQRISLRYPFENPSLSTLVRISWQSGEVRTVLARPSQNDIALPAPETAMDVVSEYFVLGIWHILAGPDHLLFVLCLLFIAGTPRRVLITVTGFTLAHSVTLISAALEMVHVPIAPTEAVIALSILFLAVEILRNRRDTLTWRYPAAVSVSFGFLHGFGFAAALGDIGLPQTEVPLALFFFNLGIEAGQLLVLGLVAVTVFSCRTLLKRRFLPPARFAAYAVGLVAAFWMVERIDAFLT